MKNIFATFLALIALTAFTACETDVQDPGSEYMPDMGHSIAQEANVLTNYYYNTWDEESTIKLRTLQERNMPVPNTVPRGYAGVAFAGGNTSAVMDAMQGKDNSMAIPMNGSVPYYYADTEEERTRAISEIQANPFPITIEGMERGQELYDIFCGICHGVKADGNGWLVDEANLNAKYPAAPANFLLDDHINSSNGRYYHAIMYGKNVMGAYKDKISYEERWQVIHYIRSLQAKEKKVEYSADVNTLNAAFGTPGGKVVAPIAEAAPVMEEGEHHEHHGEEHHEGHHGGADHSEETHDDHSEGDHSNHEGHDH
ncbi:MAG: mono/diheme cytochrome c family protein [Saprospiraceae bacterium]|jgi:mono/diheme cytochrome c family protein